MVRLVSRSPTSDRPPLRLLKISKRSTKGALKEDQCVYHWYACKVCRWARWVSSERLIRGIGFAVPQLRIAWYNLDMTRQLFIPKWLTVITTCGTIAVMRTSREREAIWGLGAQTNTRVVGFALLLKGTYSNFTECFIWHWVGKKCMYNIIHLFKLSLRCCCKHLHSAFGLLRVLMC